MTGRLERLKAIAILLTVSGIVAGATIIATTPLHEACHWVMSKYFDPYIEPVEFHVFDGTQFDRGENFLFSALGYVVIKEAYPGAFKDRPVWADMLQEIVCILVQVVIACIVVFKTLGFVARIKPDLMDKLYLQGRAIG
jgi:hypothetical protein